jgi:glucuronoarabinoxylan endo-1,4-beta-xylanase
MAIVKSAVGVPGPTVTASRFISRPRFVVPLAVALCINSCLGVPHKVRIDWFTTFQVIDGFGAATNENNFVTPMSDATIDFFYGSSGIHLSLLRIRDYPSVYDCESDSERGYCLPSTGPTLLRTDLDAARKAIAKGALVWSSQWSPSGSLKANGNFLKGAPIVASAATYSAIASSLAAFALEMDHLGVPLFAVSPQNEPDVSQAYPSATWTGPQVHDFVPYLSDAFSKAGLRQTRIMVPEESTWGSFPYARTIMDDPAVASLVGIVAAHNYDQLDPSGPPAIPNVTSQHVWQTEASTFDPYDGGMANAIVWARRIHFFLSSADVNAFHYWYLTASAGGKDNQALTDADGHVALRAYALGQWSKFVRPGWRRVAVSNSSRLLVTAFSDGKSDSAVVIVNPTGSPIPNTFQIGTEMGPTVTPWMTTDRMQLERETGVNVANGEFTYTVPAQAIVTFVGQK